MPSNDETLRERDARQRKPTLGTWISRPPPPWQGDKPPEHVKRDGKPAPATLPPQKKDPPHATPRKDPATDKVRNTIRPIG